MSTQVVGEDVVPVYGTATVVVEGSQRRKKSKSARNFTLAALFVFVVSAVYFQDDIRQGVSQVAVPERVLMSEKEPGRWEAQRRASPDDLIELMLMLPLEDPKKLEDMANAVSDPDSPLYGQHWDHERLAAEIGPSPDTLKAIEEWIAASTGKSLVNATWAAASDILSMSFTVAEVEALLNAEYYLFTRPDLEAKSPSILRTLRYSVPASIRDHINWIGPTTSFPPMASIRSYQLTKDTAATAAYGDTKVTPESVHKYMKIPEDEKCAAIEDRQNGKHAILGITAFLEEYYSEQDLKLFLDIYDSDDSANRPKLHCRSCEGRGMETSLDLEYGMSIAKDCETQLWYEAGRSPRNENNEPFLKWTMSVLNTAEKVRPQVFSISYSDWEASVDDGYMKACDQAFQEMATLGISILVASGDAGVEGAQPLPHSAWPGHPHDCAVAEDFIPTFPSTSPWVTSVGATQRQASPMGASLSGGGFSHTFDRPSYQDEAVKTYLETLKDSTHVGAWAEVNERFDQGGRGFPDVALSGTSITMVTRQHVVMSGGTSASTPMFAAMVTLINDQRLQQGRPTVGHLNPVLYKNPKIFQDVKTGHNPGCDSNGFNAEIGWDPVTGLGVPMYDKMVEVFVTAGARVVPRGYEPYEAPANDWRHNTGSTNNDWRHNTAGRRAAMNGGWGKT